MPTCVTWISIGVVRVQLLAPTVFVTPEGTVPPKAWTVPKPRTTAGVPLPVSVIPLGSVTKAKVTIWAELRQLHNKIAIHTSQKRCNSPPPPITFTWAGLTSVANQFAVAVKLIVLLMAPAAAENGMVSLKV